MLLHHSYQRAPKEFGVHSIDAVGHLMTRVINPGLLSGFVPNDAPQSRPALELDHDYSFARQMATALAQAAKPDGFVVTAYSAIPVADAVRGFYDELGQPCPDIQYVNANSQNSSWFYSRNRPVTGPKTLSEATHEANHQLEVNRLRPLLDGMRHVVLVDQLAASGASIRYGREILLRAGVSSVSSMIGNWYNNAEPAYVNLEGVRLADSELSAKMHDIGSQACQATAVLSRHCT
jgi:hypothetical protein